MSVPLSTIPAVPLPKHPNGQWPPQIKDAYSLCVQREHQAAIADNQYRVILSRILGYLFVYCPVLALTPLALDINRTKDDAELFFDMADYWKTCFIQVWRRKRTPGSTPEVLHWHHPRAEVGIEQAAALLHAGPLDYDASKKLALLRQRNSCAFSGHYSLGADPTGFDRANHELFALTELCHIIPRSLITNLRTVESEHDWSKACSAVLAGLMGESDAEAVLDRFSGPNIHRLDNVIMVEPNSHGALSGNFICLKSTPKENVYTLTAVVPDTLLPSMNNKEIDLTSPKPEILPPPAPAAIELHRAVCYVRHLSGLGAMDNEDLDQDPDEPVTLPTTGDRQNKEWGRLMDGLLSIPAAPEHRRP